jgi:hypothetical protein
MRQLIVNEQLTIRQLIVKEQLTDMLSNKFSPNKLITLLGNPYSSKETIRDCYLHTLRVLQRKAYGRYNKTPIKHLSVCESTNGINPHIHAVIKFDTDVLTMDEWMVLLKKIWISTTHGIGLSLTENKAMANETWFKDVYDTAGAVDYCFKKSNGNGNDYLYVNRQY